MKINTDYLKGLIEAFESAQAPTTDINELKKVGFNYQDDDFMFHLRILADQGFIERESGDGLGYIKNVDGDITWVVVPLRLTAQGHEFLEALRNREVWDTIKTEFKDASVGTIWRVSKELLEGYTKKKVVSLLGIDD